MRAVIGYLVVAAVLVGGGLVLRSGSALERRVAAAEAERLSSLLSDARSSGLVPRRS